MIAHKRGPRLFHTGLQSLTVLTETRQEKVYHWQAQGLTQSRHGGIHYWKFQALIVAYCCNFPPQVCSHLWARREISVAPLQLELARLLRTTAPCRNLEHGVSV